MKNRFVKNLTIVVIVLVFLMIVCGASYEMISRKLLEANINNNISSVVDSISDNVIRQFQTDYQLLESKIDSVVSEISDTDKDYQMKLKLNALNTDSSIKEKILFTQNVESGFGGFVQSQDVIDTNYYYYIDGTYYRRRNSDFEYYNTDDIFIFNFDSRYCITKDGALNNFETKENKQFIFFRFDDIIVYADMHEYLDYYFTKTRIVDLENFFCIYASGEICYEKNNTGKNSLYEVLEEAGNTTNDISKYQNALSKSNVESLKFTDVTYNDINCVLIASSINSSEHIYSSEMIMVGLIDYKVVEQPVKDVLVPLLAVFFIIIFVVSGVLIVYFMILTRRKNDYEAFALSVAEEPLYKVYFDKFGHVKKMNSDIKGILKDHKKFKSIDDFLINEDYESRLKALNQHKPFTFYFLASDVMEERDFYIRGVICKIFGRFVFMGFNATHEEAEKKRNIQLAYYDSVTSLPNEEVFKKDIETYVIYSSKGSLNGKVSFMMGKIKTFKSFQSFYGKQVGNKIISEGANHLINLLDPLTMKLYYLGDANFGFLLTGLDDYSAAEAYAKSIITEFKKPIDVDSNQLIFEFCFSIYNLDLEQFSSTNASDIINSLYKVMQKVESSSIINIETYNLSIERYISSETVLENDLRKAYEENEFVMYLQPQYHLDQTRIGGFELLIRWNNPKYFYQSPLHFIEIAEQNGMITRIGEFINREAMRIASVIAPYDIELSVNVSPVQLLQAGFVKDFNSLAEEYGVDKSKIAIEITETFLMENFDLMNEKLKALRKEGFNIHLDDFCTGYSSMLYLKELPVDTIKIDKEFIKYITVDTFSKEIVSKITSLGRSLNLGIIAEGVENEKQLQFLSKNGCNIIQGFIISKAVSLEEALDLIRIYNIEKTQILDVEAIKAKKKH